jgi:hypothetical protein
MRANAMDNPSVGGVTGIWPFLGTFGFFIIMKLTASDLAAIATVLNASVAILVNLPKISAAIIKIRSLFRKKK